MTDKINMSLDDIIKNNRKPNNLSASRNLRSGPVRQNAGKQNNNGPQRSGAGPIKAGNFNRQNRRQSGPYTRPTQVTQSNGNNRWPHDKFEGQSVSKINLSNLHYRVSDQDLLDLFSEFGKIKNANVFYDKTGRSLGNAQVVFMNHASAVAAKKKYNGILLDGRNMVIVLEGENHGSGFNESRLQKPRPTPNSNQSNGAGNRGQRNNNRSAGQNNKGDSNKGGNKPKATKPKRAAPPTQAELDADLDAYISKQNA